MSDEKKRFSIVKYLNSINDLKESIELRLYHDIDFDMNKPIMQVIEQRAALFALKESIDRMIATDERKYLTKDEKKKINPMTV